MKKITRVSSILLTLCMLLAVSSCSQGAGSETEDLVKDGTAIIKTNMGDIHLEFYPKQAPKAVSNFLSLAKKGYYNGVTFHRVIRDFMIQGGDPTGTGRGGESIWGKAFADEISSDLHLYRGMLAMANSGANTNGSQFFIVQAGPDTLNAEYLESINSSLSKPLSEDVKKEYLEKGGTPWLEGKHTVFGRVTEGMDVVDKIAAVAVDSKNSGKPIEDVVINSIEVTEK